MAKLLYVGSHGGEDPTRAGLVFVGANGAKEAGPAMRRWWRWSVMECCS
jgi:hypothetical protein